MARPSENGGDRPPGSLTPEELKFQRDLQTAIQLSLQDDGGVSNQPATSELTGSSAEDGREENSANGNIVHADVNKPNVEEETGAGERKDEEEGASSTGDSAQDHDPPKEKEVGGPPCSQRPDEVQFQKDLDTLIQRSLKSACGVGKQVAASTSEPKEKEMEIDSPPCSPTPEAVQFQKDLKALVQRSLEDDYVFGNQLAASTSEPKEKEIDSPPCSPTPEAVQFHKDLKALIQSSLEDDYVVGNQLAASTSELQLAASFSKDEGKAIMVDNNTVDAVGNQPNIQDKSPAPEREHDQEEESTSGDSDNDLDSPKETGIDNPLCNPTQFDENFQRFLQTALQKSFEDACGVSKKPAAATSELTGSSSEDKSEENTADNNNVDAVDNQPNIQEKSQAPERENNQEEESSSGDTDEYVDSIISLSDTSSEDEVDDQPNDKGEEQSLKQEDVQEKEFNSEDSIKEDDSKKVNGIDSPPGSPPLDEEAQFVKDFQTAILLSMEDACGIRKQPGATTSELTAFSPEENKANNNTVNAVDKQPDILKESPPTKRGYEQKEGCFSGDSGKEQDSPKKKETDTAPYSPTPEDEQFEKDLMTAIQRSLEENYRTAKPAFSTSESTKTENMYPPVTGDGSKRLQFTRSCYGIESEETTTNDTPVIALGSRPDILKESQPLKRGDAQEESCPGYSGKEHNSPKKMEIIYTPPCILTPEEVQFERDLQTAIQLSMEDAYGFGRLPVAATSELTGSYKADDNRSNIKEESQALKGGNYQQQESSAGDSDIKNDSNDDSRVTGLLLTVPVYPASHIFGRDTRMSSEPKDVIITSVYENSAMIHQKKNSPTGDVASGTEKTAPLGRKPDRPREIDPDAPRCPVGEGAVKKMFRRPAESLATTSSPDLQPGLEEVDRVLQAPWGQSALGVWQYPHPKRLPYTEQLIVKNETHNVSKNETVSETETTDDNLKLKFQQELKEQEQLAFANMLRKRWSKPQPIGTDNVAYLQKQETVCEESEKDKPQTKNIFQEIKRWELKEYLEANKRNRMANFQQPAATRENIQPIMKNDKSQPPAIKESNVLGTGKKNPPPPPPAYSDSHNLIMKNDKSQPPAIKESNVLGTGKKNPPPPPPAYSDSHNLIMKNDLSQPPALKEFNIWGTGKNNPPPPPPPPATRDSDKLIMKNDKSQPPAIKEINGIGKKNPPPPPPPPPPARDSSKLMVWNIPPITVQQKKTMINTEPKKTTINTEQKETIISPEQPKKITGNENYKKDAQDPKSSTRPVIMNIVLKKEQQTVSDNMKETSPVEENKCTELLLHDTVQVFFEKKWPDDVSKQKDQEISDAKMVGDEQPQFTPSTSSTGTHSADFENEFNKELQICVDEKEMSEKYSSDRCKKIRCIRRRAKGMDRRNFSVSTLYHVKSDATAMQENQVSAEKINCQNKLALGEQVSLEGKDDKSVNTNRMPGERSSTSEQILSMTEEEVSNLKSVAEQNVDYLDGFADKEGGGSVYNVPPNGTDTEEESYKDELVDNFDMIEQDISIVHKIIERRAQIYGYPRCRRRRRTATAHRSKKMPKSADKQRPDDKKDATHPKTDGCEDKEGSGSVYNVPPNGADTEEESYKDELFDSFDLIEQDISIVHKIIQRRAQKYGYARCRRRRRMASAQRSKKMPKLANLQTPDDEKDATEPKTGSLRKVPSISWKGPLQTSSLYERCMSRFANSSTEGGTQTDKSCCLELQKFTRGFPGRFVRWCSCHANPIQSPPPPQVQGPPAQMQPGDVDKEKGPNQQPVVPVVNGIANGKKSHSEPLQELDNDVKDKSDFEQKFEITQEQSTVIQAHIRNYLRTFGIPVQQVTSVSFVRDASFVADKDTAKGENVLAEQRSNDDDSSKQNKKSSSTDDDSDKETDKAPRDVMDH